MSMDFYEANRAFNEWLEEICRTGLLRKHYYSTRDQEMLRTGWLAGYEACHDASKNPSRERQS